MTTVIVISHDNSVIITNTADTADPDPAPATQWSPASSAASTGTGDSAHGTSASRPRPAKKSAHGTVGSVSCARKLSVSTLESDSEELNHSSSSTTSTLSSRYDIPTYT